VRTLLAHPKTFKVFSVLSTLLASILLLPNLQVEPATAQSNSASAAPPLQCNDVSLGSDTREGIKVNGDDSDTRRGGTVVRGQNCDTANQGQLQREAMQALPNLMETMGKMMGNSDDRETYDDCVFFNGPQACGSLKPSKADR
jgi:hypothetical protein